MNMNNGLLKVKDGWGGIGGDGQIGSAAIMSTLKKLIKI